MPFPVRGTSLKNRLAGEKDSAGNLRWQRESLVIEKWLSGEEKVSREEFLDY